MKMIITIAALLLLVQTVEANVLVEFVSDDYVMYQNYPLAGYLRFVNESSTNYMVEGCLALLDSEGFDITVHSPSGKKFEIPGERAHTDWIKRPKIVLPEDSEVRVPIFLLKHKWEMLFNEQGRYEIVFDIRPLEITVTHTVEVLKNCCSTIKKAFEKRHGLIAPFSVGELWSLEECVGRVGSDSDCETFVQLLYDYQEGGAYARSVLYGNEPTADKESHKNALVAMSKEHIYNKDFWRYLNLINYEDKQPRNQLGFVYTYRPDRIWPNIE